MIYIIEPSRRIHLCHSAFRWQIPVGTLQFYVYLGTITLALVVSICPNY